MGRAGKSISFARRPLANLSFLSNQDTWLKKYTFACYNLAMDFKPPESASHFTPSSKDLLPMGNSREGFLAEGQILDRIIKRDGEALALLGYTAREVAELLEPVIEIRNERGVEYTAPNGKKYTIRALQYRGWQDCPWKDVSIPPNSSKDIYVKKDTSEVRIPGMLPHLIKSHNFFEGGPYRLAPEDIVELFGVERNPGSIEEAKKLPL